MSGYAVVFVVAAIVTFLATPLVRRYVIRVGAVYQPNDRTVHTTPLPTLGGIAIYVGLVASLAVSSRLPFFADLYAVPPNWHSIATVVTCTLMLGLGVIDDTRGTTVLSKFIAQVFIGGVLVLFGVQLSYLWFPGIQVLTLSGDLPVILTIIWAVAIPNAVNLVDGLDGLAAGMVAIASAAFFIFVVRTPGPLGDVSQAALISAITCGVCLGFLPWNFHPAKIFMGDAGSMLLGMLLAIATIEGIGNNFTAPSGGQIAVFLGTLAVPLLVLFIPFLDVVLAIVRRTRRGQGIGHADKEHLHHRLMDIGHGHRQAVLLMYLWSALVSGGALAVGLIDGRFVVGMILFGAAALFLITALPRLAARRNGAAAAASNGSHAPEEEVDRQGNDNPAGGGSV
jgi:UDP-GlcNAc:undecaprenyl-phosphate/decaprenyl-phosphate GlcNAc-1-phosphate transferase